MSFAGCISQSMLPTSDWSRQIATHIMKWDTCYTLYFFYDNEMVNAIIVLLAILWNEIFTKEFLYCKIMCNDLEIIKKWKKRKITCYHNFVFLLLWCEYVHNLIDVGQSSLCPRADFAELDLTLGWASHQASTTIVDPFYWFWSGQL